MKSLLLCLSLLGLLISCNKESTRTLLFVGSFTEGKPANGIQVYDFAESSGKLKLLYEQPQTINPSFLKISDDGRFLYSVMESQLPHHGKVASFAVDSINGTLSFLGAQDSGGRNPAHLNLHPFKDFLINSNYTDASLSIFPIQENGRLQSAVQIVRFNDSSIIKGRQDEAHIHSSNFSPDGDFLFGQDLGADKVRAFKVNFENELPLESKGVMVMKPGSGPRHFTFHPNGRFGYSISELSGRVTAYHYSDENLIFIADYPSYATEQKVYRAADIHISPDGKFLYTSNRGPEEDSIAIFSIDHKTGRLDLVGHEPTYGKHPRNFCIDPAGKFLLVANQYSNNVVVYRRDSLTGKLTKLPQELSLSNPSSLQMYVYQNP